MVKDEPIEMQVSLALGSDITWTQENQFLAQNERMFEDLLSELVHKEAYMIILTRQVTEGPHRGANHYLL
jgi:hypothetical protein